MVHTNSPGVHVEVTPLLNDSTTDDGTDSAADDDEGFQDAYALEFISSAAETCDVAELCARGLAAATALGGKLRVRLLLASIAISTPSTGLWLTVQSDMHFYPSRCAATRISS